MFYLAAVNMSEIRTEKTQSEWYSAAQVGITIWLNYSLADMPGTLLVNTLGRGRLPTLYRRATEPTMVKISATTVPKIKTKGLVRKLEKQSTVSGQSRTKLCNAYAPAHVLAFTLAARPILRAILRVRRGLARTYEARTASFVSLDTRAVSRA